MSMRLEIVQVGDQFTLSMADKRIGPARRRTGLTPSLTETPGHPSRSPGPGRTVSPAAIGSTPSRGRRRVIRRAAAEEPRSGLTR